MKKQFLFNLSKRVSRKLLTAAVVIFLMSNGSASAQTQAAYTGEPAVSATIKHVGSNEFTNFFQLVMDNESGEKYNISIKTADGTLLYQDIFQDKKFDKRFHIAKLDENSRLVFTIRSVKSNETQTFEINTSTQYVEDVVVKKL